MPSQLISENLGCSHWLTALSRVRDAHCRVLLISILDAGFVGWETAWYAMKGTSQPGVQTKYHLVTGSTWSRSTSCERMTITPLQALSSVQ